MRIPIDGKQLIDLSHDRRCHCILRIELQDLSKVSFHVRPACSMNDPLPSDLVVSCITVCLQKPFKPSQEPFRPIPPTAGTEVKHYTSSRSPVLPEIGLMMFASAFLDLYLHRSLVGLDIATAQ